MNTNFYSTKIYSSEYFLGTFDFSSTIKTTEVTLGIHERVALLKSQIVDNIKANQLSHHNIAIEENTDPLENVEYEDDDSPFITPINENDPRKKKELFKLKAIKTTREIGRLFKNINDQVDSNIHKQNKAPKRNKKIGRNSKHKPTNVIKKTVHNKTIKKSRNTDVFYRRYYSLDSLNALEASQSLHCQDLITPFVTGVKTTETVYKRISYDNHKVKR